jgi:hypothetical protein
MNNSGASPAIHAILDEIPIIFTCDQCVHRLILCIQLGKPGQKLEVQKQGTKGGREHDTKPDITIRTHIPCINNTSIDPKAPRKDDCSVSCRH